MSSAETGEEGDVPGIADYETGVLQLGDTELNGVTDEQIIEQYGDAGLDAVVYHGDASKKQDQRGWVDQDEYLDQLEETYQSLNRIGEELDVDVLTLPGNHEPISGNHFVRNEEGEEINDEEYMEEVDELVADRYEDFSDFEGNAYEFFIDSESEEVDNENITDFSGSVYETEGGVSLVGLGTHMEPELDEAAYSLLNSELGLKELGYGEEELEEASDELSEEPGFDYGWISDIPYIGDWIEKIGDGIAGWLDYGAVDVSPEDVELEDLEELGEEFMTEEHVQYLEDIEELKESEEYEEFEEKLAKIEELIGTAEGEVALFNHSTPFGKENQYGSMALTEATERFGNDLAMIGGGHSHSSGVYELNDVPIVNAAETYTEIGFGDELYTEQHGIGGAAAEGPTEEGMEGVQQTIEAMEEHDDFEAFWSDQEEMIERDLESIDQDIPEEKVEEIKQGARESMKDLWEKKDQLQQPAASPTPDSPEDDSTEEAAA